MSDRKLLPVEVEAEGYAKDLLDWFDLAHQWERESGTPLEAMQAAAQLRRMAATIERLNRDLATERRLHRDTEKRAELYKTERDVARRERDDRFAPVTISSDLRTAIGWDLDGLIPMGLERGDRSDAELRKYLFEKKGS